MGDHDDYDYDWDMDYDWDHEDYDYDWDMGYEWDMDYDMDYDYDWDMDYEWEMDYDYEWDMDYDYEGMNDYEQHAMDGLYWADCSSLDAMFDTYTVEQTTVNGEMVSCTVSASMMGMEVNEDCEDLAAQMGVNIEDIELEWYAVTMDYDMNMDYDYDMNMDYDYDMTMDYEEPAMADGQYRADCPADDQLNSIYDSCEVQLTVEGGEMASCKVVL